MPQPTLFSFLKTASQQKKDDGVKTNQETKDKFNTVRESPKKSKRFGVKESATEGTTCTPRKDSVTKQTDRKQVKQKTSENAKKQKLLLQDKVKKSPPKKSPDNRAEFDSCAKNNKMKRDIGSIYRSEDKMSHSGPVTKRQKTEESIKQTESSKKKHIKKSPTSSKEHKEDESDVNRNSNNIDSEKNTGEVESDCESPVKRAKSSKTKSRTVRCISSSESDLENGDGEDAKTSEQSTELESKTKNSETGIRGVDCSAEDSKPALHSFFAPRKGGRELASESTKPPKDSKEEGGYDPTKHNYHPVNDACWKKGEKVPYLALAKTLHEIEKISGRLKMIEILANFFRSVIALTPDDLLHCVYLCLNRIAPEYEGIELGVGETLLIKAVAQATGRTVGQIKSEVSVKGDLGLVAESSRGSQRVMFSFPKLTVSSVFTKFKDISQMTGSSVMAKKIDKIQAMFSACRQCEARYIIRSLSGKLRIGLAEQSVLSALALAAVLTPPGQPDVLNSSSKMSSDSFKKELEAKTLILKTTYCECPNYDLIIPVLLKEGISGLPEHCHLMPGIPLKPMLAHPTKGIDEVLRRFDTSDSKIEFTCEFKYDGERAQIHNTGDDEIKIYSRNQEDNTSKYPDIISRLGKARKPETKSFILDSEVVAWDREASHILPFQVLSTRKKKDAADSDIKVQVCVMAFDLLYLNGEALVRKPLKERRELLHNAFVEVPSEFMFAHSTDGNSAEVMQEFLEESVKGHCEGLMVKSLVIDATYEIAKRSHNWLKLKKDYLEGVGDTLDLVVIGGWYGKGKRTGSYGGFLLACYDDETEEFQTICKIGTGFKDSDLEAHTKFLKAYVINSAGLDYRYSKNLEPDVWFEAVQVWEVKCADLSISPVHKAAVGIVDPEKGISLRFPRFLRIRDDKKPEDATKAIQVAYMYNNQQQVKSASKDSKADDEDYY